MPTEKEMKKIELATVYEIRLLLTSDDKDEYSKEELLQILDQYARDKNTPRITERGDHSPRLQ